MAGNELNYAMTAFTVGNLIGQVPNNIMLTRVRPSIWIPSLQVHILAPAAELTMGNVY